MDKAFNNMIKTAIFFVVLLFGMNAAYAEPILVTYRDDGNMTIWDGKWTFPQEWKRTSYDAAYGGSLIIRTGHDYQYLYVLIDYLSQHQFSKHSDYGIVCIDSKYDKTTPLKDDYCFTVAIGSSNPITLEGGNILGLTNHYMKIKNDPNLIAVGGISDQNDRYSDIPHSSYEFRIPIEIFGSSDKYGFFAGAYVANENKLYTWPDEISEKDSFSIPSPDKWGEMVSPDESLPEFPLPSVILVISIILLILLSKKDLLDIRSEFI